MMVTSWDSTDESASGGATCRSRPRSTSVDERTEGAGDAGAAAQRAAQEERDAARAGRAARQGLGQQALGL